MDVRGPTLVDNELKNYKTLSNWLLFLLSYISLLFCVIAAFLFTFSFNSWINNIITAIYHILFDVTQV